MTLLCIIFAVFLVTAIFSMADMLVQSALDAGGNDNVTVIVLDICGKSSDYSANDDWNVSKIDDHEDIGDLQESTLQTLRAVQ